jgi:hypothetical protein
MGLPRPRRGFPGRRGPGPGVFRRQRTTTRRVRAPTAAAWRGPAQFSPRPGQAQSLLVHLPAASLGLDRPLVGSPWRRTHGQPALIALLRWAGAIIVFRWRLRFSVAGVIVRRWGRYTTRKSHNDPNVRSCMLCVVTVRTLTSMPRRRRPAPRRGPWWWRAARRGGFGRGEKNRRPGA